MVSTRRASPVKELRALNVAQRRTMSTVTRVSGLELVGFVFFVRLAPLSWWQDGPGTGSPLKSLNDHLARLGRRRMDEPVHVRTCVGFGNREEWRK